MNFALDDRHRSMRRFLMNALGSPPWRLRTERQPVKAEERPVGVVEPAGPVATTRARTTVPQGDVDKTQTFSIMLYPETGDTAADSRLIASEVGQRLDDAITGGLIEPPPADPVVFAWAGNQPLSGDIGSPIGRSFDAEPTAGELPADRRAKLSALLTAKAGGLPVQLVGKIHGQGAVGTLTATVLIDNAGVTVQVTREQASGTVVLRDQAFPPLTLADGDVVTFEVEWQVGQVEVSVLAPGGGSFVLPVNVSVMANEGSALLAASGGTGWHLTDVKVRNFDLPTMILADPFRIPVYDFAGVPVKGGRAGGTIPYGWLWVEDAPVRVIQDPDDILRFAVVCDVRVSWSQGGRVDVDPGLPVGAVPGSWAGP